MGLIFVLQGELPPELLKVYNRNARAFITACLQPHDLRPTADQLLEHDFLKEKETEDFKFVRGKLGSGGLEELEEEDEDANEAGAAIAEEVTSVSLVSPSKSLSRNIAASASVSLERASLSLGALPLSGYQVETDSNNRSPSSNDGNVRVTVGTDGYSLVNDPDKETSSITIGGPGSEVIDTLTAGRGLTVADEGVLSDTNPELTNVRTFGGNGEGSGSGRSRILRVQTRSGSASGAELRPSPAPAYQREVAEYHALQNSPSIISVAEPSMSLQGEFDNVGQFRGGSMRVYSDAASLLSTSVFDLIEIDPANLIDDNSGKSLARNNESIVVMMTVPDAGGDSYKEVGFEFNLLSDDPVVVVDEMQCDPDLADTIKPLASGIVAVLTAVSDVGKRVAIERIDRNQFELPLADAVLREILKRESASESPYSQYVDCSDGKLFDPLASLYRSAQARKLTSLRSWGLSPELNCEDSDYNTISDLEADKILLNDISYLELKSMMEESTSR